MRIVRVVLTVTIFLLLTAYGFLIATHKTLWNDEYYSLITSTTNISYGKMISGGVNEGNNSPLFYGLQKLQCNLFSYHPPQDWIEGRWTGIYRSDQLFLRIQPVLAGALAISILFYYFSSRYSLAIGFYAFIIAMTSSMFLSHWVEARPYSLWFALGIFQSLLLINILEDPAKQNKKKWACLIVVHWLLALTSVVSGIQILVAGIVLWMYRQRTLSLHLLMVLIPLGICGYYHMTAPHYQFYFIERPIGLLNDNFSIPRLFIIFLSAVFLIVRYRSEDWKAKLEIKYLIFLLLMVIAFLCVMVELIFSQSQGQHDFEVCNRYFMSLVPVGIIGTVLYSVYLMRIFRSKFWALLIAGIMLFAGIIVM